VFHNCFQGDRATKRGEIIISEQVLLVANMDSSGLERRSLELKGISGQVPVRVLHG
jgi:class 3 adenylate cyclase